MLQMVSSKRGLAQGRCTSLGSTPCRKLLKKYREKDAVMCMIRGIGMPYSVASAHCNHFKHKHITARCTAHYGQDQLIPSRARKLSSLVSTDAAVEERAIWLSIRPHPCRSSVHHPSYSSICLRDELTIARVEPTFRQAQILGSSATHFEEASLRTI